MFDFIMTTYVVRVKAMFSVMFVNLSTGRSLSHDAMGSYPRMQQWHSAPPQGRTSQEAGTAANKSERRDPAPLILPQLRRRRKRGGGLLS